MTTNQTIDGVPRKSLEQALKLAAVFDDGGDGADAESARGVVWILRALLDAPAKSFAQVASESAYCQKTPSSQPQGERVALSADELKFLEAIAMNPGAKLNDGIASSEDGNSLWVRLEDLGLIECIGSYKWKLTFNAVELGVKAFLGQQPAPVAVVPTCCGSCPGGCVYGLKA